MGIAVCIGPCVGFCPVSGFDDDLFGKDILFIEQHLKCPLYLVQRELALVKSREDGDQNIGIMLDVIQIEVILVIARECFRRCRACAATLPPCGNTVPPHPTSHHPR